MDQVRFDKIGTYLTQGRTSRRKALQGAAGLAAVGMAATGLQAAVAQDATPAAGASETTSAKEFLFVQSFESGTIVPKDGAEGTYTVTLQHGLGQTLYFSDRPERIVGATPTPQFLDGIGFPTDNPPNAALVIGTEGGGTDIAVVELTNPSYEVASSTATYDVTVLKNFEGEGDMQFQEATADLATVAASFGSAHLFIDDCPDSLFDGCYNYSSEENTFICRGWISSGNCWNSNTWLCEPCGSYSSVCNQTYESCHGNCEDDIGICGSPVCNNKYCVGL